MYTVWEAVFFYAFSLGTFFLLCIQSGNRFSVMNYVSDSVFTQISRGFYYTFCLFLSYSVWEPVSFFSHVFCLGNNFQVFYLRTFFLLYYDLELIFSYVLNQDWVVFLCILSGNEFSVMNWSGSPLSLMYSAWESIFNYAFSLSFLPCILSGNDFSVINWICDTTYCYAFCLETSFVLCVLFGI